jgi:hypothetical protein
MLEPLCNELYRLARSFATIDSTARIYCTINVGLATRGPFSGGIHFREKFTFGRNPLSVETHCREKPTVGRNPLSGETRCREKPTFGRNPLSGETNLQNESSFEI